MYDTWYTVYREIERRARIRLAWLKRYEKIGNISQV
jgi:hypothetical protein